MQNSTPQTSNSIFILLAFSSLLLGLSMLLIGADKAITTNASFYFLDSLLSPAVTNLIASIAFISISVLSMLATYRTRYTKLLAALLVFVSSFVLLSLFSDARWIESLGGFPAIGSGQGVIKYFALLSIGLYFLLKNKADNEHLKMMMIFPVVLVLLWIGGMKFTLLEAKGIEPLVASSPLMAWMYQVWDLQTTSNLIGVYDLIAVVILIASLKFKQLLLPALLMTGAVFIVTQTFLFTWTAAISSETLLTSGGHFLIKDIWFIINLIVFYQLTNETSFQSES